jgi:hypothetical protein
MAETINHCGRPPDKRSRKFIFKLLTFCLMSVSLFSFVVPCLADPLPSEFTGQWGALYDEGEPDASAKCSEREGVEVSFKDIVWNTEGGCTIGNAKRGRFAGSPAAGNVAVSLTCFWEEGRRRPLKIKKTEIWSIFKIGGKTFMSQTAISDAHTMIYEKCD